MKNFRDVIQNKVWSSRELLTEGNQPIREEKGKREKVYAPGYHQSSEEKGWGPRRKWVPYVPPDSRPTEWSLICFPHLSIGRNCMVA